MSRRSRLLMVHPEANQVKLAGLEELYQAYGDYLAVCCQYLIGQQILKPTRKQYRECPQSDTFSSQIEEACREHAAQIVAGWAAATYERVIKRKIGAAKRVRNITDEQAHALYRIGKYGISKPTKQVSEQDLLHYWEFLDQYGGSKPSVSARTGMLLNINTAVLHCRDLTLTSWWVDLSSLTKGQRIRVPLAQNPNLKTVEEAAAGMKLWKNRKGEWCLQVVERQEYAEPTVDPDAPRIGVDVGLNCLAATSDGRIFGRSSKQEFRRRHDKIVDLRANRQRQGLLCNSPRLDRMEEHLSGWIKTQTGHVANRLIDLYPGYSFVIENLHLKGTKGSKRFRYKGVHGFLVLNAPTIVVNPAYTSQTCPSCGVTCRQNRFGTKFKCRSCGQVSHADVTGGLNLLRRSEDPGIQLADSPASVRTLLEARYRRRRSSAKGAGVELVASNRMLTVGVPAGTCIASNALGESQ